MQKTVVVTQEDINAGLKLIPTHDPIALALKREFNSEFACVSNTKAYIIKKGMLFEMSLPEYIGDWLASFDIGNPVTSIRIQTCFVSKLDPCKLPPERIDL